MTSHSLSAALPQLDPQGVESRRAGGETLPADRSLLKLLREIEEAPPRPAAYLHTLERLWRPVRLAQEKLAEGYAAQSVPLDTDAGAALARAGELWAAVLRGYRRVLGAALSGAHSDVQAGLPLILQRALAGAGELIITRFVARREAEENLWRFAHEIYATAEARGLSAAPAEPQSDTPLTAAYTQVLLLALACPYAFSQREFRWVRRWAAHWTGKVRLVKRAPQQGAYAVDLAGQAAPRWTRASAEGANIRFLDLADIGHAIKKRLRRLEDGAAPETLGLGDDCPPHAAAEVLKALGRAWLEVPATRELGREPAPSPTLLASGFAAVHRALAENSRPGPASRPGYSYGEADRLHTLQRAFDDGASWESRPPGLENWERFEESPSGFRLRRSEAGASLALRQLLALRPRGARQFMLCEVRSICEHGDRAVSIRAQPLPGFARTCTVLASDQRTRVPAEALLLPPGQGLPSVLLLPAGWYQSGREIEIRDAGRTTRVRLTALLERGFDYERVQTSNA